MTTDRHTDVEEIRALKARYFRLMDTKQWDALWAVFTPDVRMDTTEDSGTVIVGVADYAPFLMAAIGDVITVHHGHMAEIEFVDDDTATGIWAMEDRLWWPEGSPIRSMHGWGHYHERYVRTSDGWRIAELRLTRLNREFVLADD